MSQTNFASFQVVNLVENNSFLGTKIPEWILNHALETGSKRVDRVYSIFVLDDCINLSVRVAVKFVQSWQMGLKHLREGFHNFW